MIRLGSLNRKSQLMLAFASLVLSILISTILYYYLHDNKRLLNIVTFPFHLLGAFSLVKILESLIDYQFPKDSFWCCEKGEYVPLFIRARTFKPIPMGMLALAASLFTLYTDWKTGFYSTPENRIWIMNNMILIILAILVPAKIISRYILDFDEVINNFKNLFDNENYLYEFKKSIKTSLLNKYEIVPILIIVVLVRLSMIVFPYSSWGWGNISFL